MQKMSSGSSAAIEALRDTWPRFKGHIVGVEYIPKAAREAHLEEWRKWCKEHPDRKVWPPHLTSYLETLDSFKLAQAKQKEIAQ